MAWQRTLAREVCLAGVGLHTSKPSRVVLRPAPADHGLAFIRTDVVGSPVIPVNPGAVAASHRCTALGRDGVQVMTVEHLVAALRGLGVDNARVEVEGPEVPGLDGSARPFVQAVREAGLTCQEAARRVRRLKQAVWVSESGRFAVALPDDGFSVACAFVSDHPGLPDQYAEFPITEEVFAREIAPARTVAFLREVESLRRAGLGLGATAETVVLVGPGGVMGPVRFSNEVVRHKVLDLVGDLALVGPLCARVFALRPGHALTQALARRLVEPEVSYLEDG